MSEIINNICATAGCTEDVAREALTANNYDGDAATHKILDKSQGTDENEFESGWQTFSRGKKGKKKTDVVGGGDGFQETKNKKSYNRSSSFKRDNKFKNFSADQSKSSQKVQNANLSNTGNKRKTENNQQSQQIPASKADRNLSIDLSTNNELGWDNAGDLDLNKEQTEENSYESPDWAGSDDFGDDALNKRKESLNKQSENISFHGPDTQLIGACSMPAKLNAWKIAPPSIPTTVSIPNTNTTTPNITPSSTSAVHSEKNTPINTPHKEQPQYCPTDTELLANLLPIFGKVSSTPQPPLSSCKVPSVPVLFSGKLQGGSCGQNAVSNYKFCHDSATTNSKSPKKPQYSPVVSQNQELVATTNQSHLTGVSLANSSVTVNDETKNQTVSTPTFVNPNPADVSKIIGMVQNQKKEVEIMLKNSSATQYASLLSQPRTGHSHISQNLMQPGVPQSSYNLSMAQSYLNSQGHINPANTNSVLNNSNIYIQQPHPHMAPHQYSNANNLNSGNHMQQAFNLHHITSTSQPHYVGPNPAAAMALNITDPLKNYHPHQHLGRSNNSASLDQGQASQMNLGIATSGHSMNSGIMMATESGLVDNGNITSTGSTSSIQNVPNYTLPMTASYNSSMNVSVPFSMMK